MIEKAQIIKTDAMNGELVRRATAAYYRGANTVDGAVQQPSPGEVVETDSGLTYVRFTGANGTLAVYRVRVVHGQTVLKGLRRWPKALD